MALLRVCCRVLSREVAVDVAVTFAVSVCRCLLLLRLRYICYILLHYIYFTYVIYTQNPIVANHLISRRKDIDARTRTLIIYKIYIYSKSNGNKSRNN